MTAEYMRVVVVYCGPTASDNQAAVAAVRRLTNVQVEIVGETFQLADVFSLPYVEDWDGHRYYGLESIEQFVGRQLEAVSPAEASPSLGAGAVYHAYRAYMSEFNTAQERECQMLNYFDFKQRWDELTSEVRPVFAERFRKGYRQLLEDERRRLATSLAEQGLG